MTMNKKERIQMVRAMETIARTVNNENVFNTWLTYGVADGDINETTTDEELESYVDDDTLCDLMTEFLHLMRHAQRSGGLYVDGVISR